MISIAAHVSTLEDLACSKVKNQITPLDLIIFFCRNTEHCLKMKKAMFSENR